MLPICFNICIFVKFQKSEIHPPIACCTGVTMTCIQKMILGLIQGRTQNFLFGGVGELTLRMYTIYVPF
jgi:hypothetical protein